MQNALLELQSEVLQAIAGSEDAAALEQVRVRYLGRSGSVPALLEKMRDVPKEERPAVGRLANELKEKIASAFDEKKNTLRGGASATSCDATLPGRPVPCGSLHPMYQVRDRAVDVFRRLGFAIADGPEIEAEYYNFDALNTPHDHPARDVQQTFYLEKGVEPKPGKASGSALGRALLRTQTSPVQIRVMEKQGPPVRVVAPGRCYRRDEIDATHAMTFHQMEGLVVDKGVTLADMKGMLEFFFRELLGSDLQFRFRPHFFPFTEPSFEIDCSRPGQEVKGKKWLEICGCGMVDPNVFKHVGYDPEVYTGYAFGFGLERLTMILHGISDLRLLSENDTRFLKQFSNGLLV